MTVWRRLSCVLSGRPPEVQGRLWAMRLLLNRPKRQPLTMVKDTKIVRFKKRLAA